MVDVVSSLSDLFNCNILKENADKDKANEALAKVELILKEAGFKSKNDSVIGFFLDTAWHQAEKEYPHLL